MKPTMIDNDNETLLRDAKGLKNKAGWSQEGQQGRSRSWKPGHASTISWLMNTGLSIVVLLGEKRSVRMLSTKGFVIFKY